MTLTEKIEKMLFEDTWNKTGSEYMSHPYEQEQHLTVQPELPIAASPKANMQLTDVAPPVDDETYIPANNKELASALAVLAEKVPDDFVENLYRQIRSAVMNAEMQTTNPPVDDSPLEQGDLDETIQRIAKALLSEAYWGDIKLANHNPDDEELDPDLDDEGNFIGTNKKAQSQGKHLAKYYRSKPGVDPSKLKGTGESTMVTGSGRTAQNVLGPLYSVRPDELEDAVEYLRLQFKMLAHDHGLEKFPAEAPKTFQGMYFKKLVPKMDKSQLDNFLESVIADFKRRNKRWLKDMFEKAMAEVKSERAAYLAMKADLEKEANLDDEQSGKIDNIIDTIS